MATEYFQGTDLRSYFHTFSRAFTAEGQTFVDQAPLKAGHNVSADNVRGQVIKFLADTAARNAEFPGVAKGQSGLNADDIQLGNNIKKAFGIIVIKGKSFTKVPIIVRI